MTPKLLILTGPPSCSSIVESSCTITGFEAPFLHLFDLDLDLDLDLGLQTAGSFPPPPTAQCAAAWRSLPLTRRPLPTGLGFTQTHAVDVSTFSNGAFFTTADATALDDDDDDYDGPSHEDTSATSDLLTQFCEKSLRVHTSDDTSDSQSQSQSLHLTESFTTSSILSEDEHPARARHLSDLGHVPSAKQVTSLAPQTITLNIIVGVLSVAQPRTVTTRWGSTLSLVEVLVGDDTAAGFAVTFWVPSDKVAGSDVVALRRQDVVLLENVALHVFRDKVYGQSLRRGLTKLHLLWRADGSGHYSSRGLRAKEGGNPQREKTRIVRDWVARFVGLDPQARRTRGGSSWDRPPDDTQ
ncbi:hypothetical protein C2857_005924 [Epichloe festucae Fl1]|uniref:Nucleic acid-binding, OB-fold protein n=1 Tax=Epichloe festucae (strain Fl1) TaxID=877507 RepID=A0A7S9KL99_EPIFF|nr:hypothetical protein C2857_005924 [Epichloe festucae Fl1]